MACKRADLIGMVFGSLCVIEFAHIYNGHSYWLCRCECGGHTVARGSHLKLGNISSCGCKKGNTTHGESKSRLYSVWRNMIGRCNNPNTKEYHRYGGRGISVCAEWDDYETFRDWAVSHGYAPNLSIDRKDNNGNYTPDNCRWVTWDVQQNNKRNTTYLTIGGCTRTLTEWCEISGIKRDTIRRRVNKGWSEEHLLIPPDTNGNRNLGGKHHEYR